MRNDYLHVSAHPEQTSALSTVRADLLLISSKDRPSLQPYAFPKNSTPPREARAVVRALRWGGSDPPRQL
jgi:hypothetical protein